MAGVPLALNAGDALLVEAIALLRANRAALGSRMAARVLGEFERTVRRTVQGQAMELGWRRERRFDITADQYVDLIVRKTCWYTTIHPLRVGALIGGWNRVPLEPVVRFGTYLGAAFQLQDDLLNLVGDERVYGKEILGDLHEGKCTLVLAHLMTTLDEHERADLVHGFFAAPRAQRSDADVRRILAMMHDRGSIEAARGFADGITSLAVGAFDEAFAPAPPSPDRDFLRDMVDYMLDRDR
jgi:geranylgeranyl diphosphate synthase type II